MKKIFFILFFVIASKLTFSQQQVQYIANDTNLLIVTTQTDTTFISLSEINYQLKELDRLIDEYTSTINQLTLRRNEYLNLKEKYLKLIKK